MYALQNQNVERKIAKQIDIKFLQQNNNGNTGTKNKPDQDNSISTSTSIDQLTNPVPEDYQGNQDIPSILIPRDEPEPLPQMESFIISKPEYEEKISTVSLSL